MDELKIRYRLYALDVTREAMDKASAERFSRVTPFYVLFYTDGEIPTEGIELAGSETKRLSEEDERWLADCNFVILGEELERRKPELLKDLSERVDALERVLEEKKREREA